MKSEVLRVTHELQAMKDKIKENSEKIKVNKTLPYLVSNVIELLDVDPNDQEEDGANIDLDSQRKGKCAVIKTSTRQTYFLPVIGLVDAEKLKPGDLVGVNKDSYLILETLPTEYDSRVKAMEVDERPTEQYSDIGGLDKQIQELVEAIVLPMNHKEKFENLGIQPPKGVLMYGPPGTGKTLLARACAAQTKATFLKLAGPQLVQMFIGDGAKLVRDAFALAKEKAPSIIFIDELDAIGTKRFDSEKAGDREVQRTMLELLNQLDGFQPNTQVKVIAATNRVDILDPALLRSGRLDRKIEFPMPNEEARARIMQIHSRKMNVSPDVNYEELARCTDDFNGAQCKAVCVEANWHRKGQDNGHSRREGSPASALRLMGRPGTPRPQRETALGSPKAWGCSHSPCGLGKRPPLETGAAVPHQHGGKCRMTGRASGTVSPRRARRAPSPRCLCRAAALAAGSACGDRGQARGGLSMAGSPEALPPPAPRVTGLQASRMLDLACCPSWIAPTAPSPALAGRSARNTSRPPDDCGTTTSWLRDRTPEPDRSRRHNPPAGDPGQVTSGTQFPHL
uniref:Proteasome 26S subunit, ATPase 3 n=1 Tax=Ailuropoda melanoleuca TaxID=9646 RepID=A0A7N5P313_AILME